MTTFPARRMFLGYGLAAAFGLAVLGPLAFAEPTATPGNLPQGSAAASGLAVATFAAGCFWCVETDFDKVPGVVETVSGFAGGRTANPTYEEVGQGRTGHAEAVQVTYDPAKVSYPKLLDYYWRHVDLVDGGGQFCDRGDQYRPAIFVHTPEQRAAAEASKEALARSGRFAEPIAVEIAAVGPFTAADEKHQNYAQKNPLQYRYYRAGCGRDARLKQLWADPPPS